MTKGQWTLIGILVVQLGLLGVLHKSSTTGATEPHQLVTGLDTGSITKIEVGSKSGESVVVQRNGSGWEIASANGYPADATKVDALIDKIAKATVRAPVVTSSKYHDSLEVTDEKAQAHLKLFGADASKPLVDLLIGKTTTGGAHVRLAGSDEVYDVRDISPWEMRSDTATWMQRKLVDVPTEAVTRVSVKNANGSFELEKTDDAWSVAAPEASKGHACTKDKVNAIVRAVASLSAAGAGGKLDAAAQGLGDEAPTATITTSEGAITVRIGGPVPDKDGQVYITRDGFGYAATQWEASLNNVKNAKLEELEAP